MTPTLSVEAVQVERRSVWPTSASRSTRSGRSAAATSGSGALGIAEDDGLENPAARRRKRGRRVHRAAGGEHLVFEQIGIAADAADRLRDEVVEQDAVVNAAGDDRCPG